VHSRPEMITRLSADVPEDIRRAVDGGLTGWHRLLRFQAAMTFSTIEAAAAHLGAHQSAPRPPVQAARTRHRRQAPRAVRPRPAHAPSPARHRAAEGTQPAGPPGPRRPAPGSGPAGVAASSPEHLGTGSIAGPSSRRGRTGCDLTAEEITATYMANS
jgi:hypothetical protein